MNQNFYDILFLILLLSNVGCSSPNINWANANQDETKKISEHEIYKELVLILEKGKLMSIRNLRNNNQYCLTHAIKLQEEAMRIKNICNEQSFANLSISANHLELCTSCDAPPANNHCEWAEETLTEMRVMNGW